MPKTQYSCNSKLEVFAEKWPRTSLILLTFDFFVVLRVVVVCQTILPLNSVDGVNFTDGFVFQARLIGDGVVYRLAFGCASTAVGVTRRLVP